MEVLRYSYLACALVVIQFPPSQENPATDYCKMPCGSNHIACKHKDEGYGPDCNEPIDLVDINLYKELILELHNKKRDLVASGGEEKYPPASRMGEVAWDDELAYLARVKVRRCKIMGDKCRNTEKYPNLGRNSNMMRWWHDKTYTDDYILKKRIKEWMDTSKEGDVEMIKKYPEENPPGHAKFFANVIIESNHRVGCAAIRFVDEEDRNCFLINCYYSNGVVPNMTLYQGGKSASACNSKESAKFSNSCKPEEVYDYTKGSEMGDMSIIKTVRDAGAPKKKRRKSRGNQAVSDGYGI